jgi:hypothetical protein
MAPDTDRRWVLRVPPDPHLRFDTCDYSLDPALVGRRVEVRVSPTEVLALALDTGELACRHQRSFAKHRTITDLAHARALKAVWSGPGSSDTFGLAPLAVWSGPGSSDTFGLAPLAVLLVDVDCGGGFELGG